MRGDTRPSPLGGRAAGAHAHERSMIDFIMVPQDLPVTQV